MKFEPRPDNEFGDFIHIYLTRCREACPAVCAIAGKWKFEDMIPGLSDFDARLIVGNGVTVENWMQMSLAVGKIHTDLTRRHPHWARILEHPPGLNLTVAEMMEPVLYYPEFQQWTFYEGDDQAREEIGACLADKPWSRRDELFHLKKFALYYGPYDRGIDPPINLGPWENKYPLHSRFMHYFTPPIQSAVSIVQRRGMCKLEALRAARDLFPDSHVIDMILDAVDRHYELLHYYQEPHLTQIEQQLHEYLRNAYGALAHHVTLIDVDPDDTQQQVKAKLAAVAADVTERIFEGAKFGRLMKGRLLFYAERIEWFETELLIRNELGRIEGNLFKTPLITYAKARFGEDLTPSQALDRLTGDLVTPRDREDLDEFVRLCALPLPGQERQRARQVADVYDAVLRLDEALIVDLRGRL